MSNIKKLTTAVSKVCGAKIHGFYRGRFFFEGVAVVVDSDRDVPKLMKALADEGASELLTAKLHFDDMGKQRLVAWEISLFEGYPRERSFDDDDEDEMCA